MIYIIFLFGLLTGSFLNVCIFRLVDGESIVFPPSHCIHCREKLQPRDLIPVVSYLMLGGRCRYCKKKISLQYPAVELLTGFLFVLVYCRFGLTWQFSAYSILCAVLIVASFIDLKHRIIPNSLVLFGALAGLPFIVFNVTVDVVDGLLGLLAGGGILLLLALLSLFVFKKEGMGGGDIKFMGMIGLYMGWKLTLLSLLFSVYISGLVCAILLLGRKIKLGKHIPFGPFLSIGTVIALFWGNEIITWYLKLIG